MLKRKNISVYFMVFIFLIIGIIAGCSKRTPPAKSPVKKQLIIATTTSTQDTGLLDVLVPDFEKINPQYAVKPIAVGSGEAMEMGKKGDADVLLVHSPDDEKKFMEQKFGFSRKPVMYNDFVIIGPKEDPVKTKDSNAHVAFRKIADSGSFFISRADNSGTNKKELKIWVATKIQPKGKWYIESGQGMSETLRIADQKQAYTLSDRGTFLALSKTISLEVLVEKDKLLLNKYTVIVVSPNKFPMINYKGAKAFSDYIISGRAQKLIADFGVKKFGQPLFKGDARK